MCTVTTDYQYFQNNALIFNQSPLVIWYACESAFNDFVIIFMKS